MNAPVYNSLEIERIVEFKTIFSHHPMPKIAKCIQGFDREHLFGGLISNLVNKVVKRPFYNPAYHGNEKDIDTLRFFLSGENYALLEKSVKAIEKASRSEKIPLKCFVGASEESVLYLVREIMAVSGPYKKVSIAETESNLLKALLAANTITLEKGGGKIPFDENDEEMYWAATFLQQFGSADFLYPNRDLLMMSQTIKCIRFFEFAENNDLLKPLVRDFCAKYGILYWWMYPKALWSVYAITGGRAAIINVSNMKMKEAEQYVSVIDKSSISSQAIVPKKENIDYVQFRSYPLIKIAESEYVVFNFQLLIERIYSGLYFVLRDIASTHDIGKDRFKQFFSSEFAEQYLFCGAMKNALKDGYDFTLSENDCLMRDNSKNKNNAAPPDFYARRGNTVFLFENKDILFSGETKETGTLDDYIRFIKTRLYSNEKGRPEGVLQLMVLVDKIRSGEFQRRWDPNCPQDAIVYPVVVVPEVKFTMFGVKSFLQKWQKECGISMENVKPVAIVDLGTLCLYQHVINAKGLKYLLDGYFEQSDYLKYKATKNLNLLPNVMMSFTDYLTHIDNNTLSKFADEWEYYIHKGEVDA